MARHCDLCEGEIGQVAKRQANNAIASGKNHTHTYFCTRRAFSLTSTIILIPYLNPFRDSLRSSQHLTGAANLQDENEFFKGFAKEAQLMSNLRHPNIVMFMGVIVESDFVGLVTEFCFEGNISDVLLDESKDFDDSIFMSMIIDICRGMSFLHLHEPSIIHKDLKGQNILVNDNWQCKVADFGLSKLQTSEEMRTKPDDAAMSPQKIGAVMWSAPEVLTNENECNKASDVYR